MMRQFRKFLSALILLIAAGNATSQSCFRAGDPSRWSDAFTGNGVTGRKIMAMAGGKDGLYCLMQNALSNLTGGVTTTSAVMRWDGRRWHTVGPAFPSATSTTPRLIGMHLVGDSALYILGNFSTNTSLNSPGIVRLNLRKMQYEAVGRGLGNGYVQRALAVGDTLYIMGQFTRVVDAVKQTVANNVARYYIRSNRWDSMGTGLGGFIPNIADNIDFESMCQITAVPNGEVVFAARFATAGGISVNGLAGWKSGRGWRNLYGGPRAWNGSSTAISPIPRTVVFSPRDTSLYVGGYVGYIVNTPTSRAGQWGWARLRDTLWTKRVEDSTWKADSFWLYRSTGLNGHILYDGFIDSTRTRIYVGGEFQTIGSTGDAKVFDIATGRFSRLNKGISIAGRVRCMTWWNGRLYAAGTITEVDSVYRIDQLAQFDGKRWLPVGWGLSTASTTRGIHAMQEDKLGNVYAGGEFEYASGLFCRGLMRIDSNERIQALPQQLTGTIRRVSALGMLGDSLLIGGIFSGGGSLGSNGFVVYDTRNAVFRRLGSSGLLPTGSSSWVNAIAVVGRRIYIGGSFSSVDGVSASNLAYWDGSAWNAAGNPDGEVTRLAVSGDTVLYVSGHFARVNGSSYSRLVRHHVSGAWSRVGRNGTAGLVPSALSVNPVNGELWVGLSGSLPQPGTSTYSAAGYAVIRDSVWYDYSKLFGVSWSLSQPIAIRHNPKGEAFISGLFAGIGKDSARGVLWYADSSWAALGGGLGTNVAFTSPVSRTIAVQNNRIFIGGEFQTSGAGKQSFHLASYRLETTRPALVRVRLGPDAIVRGGYAVRASLLGVWDSLYWNNRLNRNQTWFNVYEDMQLRIQVFAQGCVYRDTVNVLVKPVQVFRSGPGDGKASVLLEGNGRMAGGSGDGKAGNVTGVVHRMAGGSGDGAAQKGLGTVHRMAGGSGDGTGQNGMAIVQRMAGGSGDGTGQNGMAVVQRMAGGSGDGTGQNGMAVVQRMAGGSGDGTGQNGMAVVQRMAGGSGDGTAQNGMAVVHRMAGGPGDGMSSGFRYVKPDGFVLRILSPLPSKTYTDSADLVIRVGNTGEYPIQGLRCKVLLNGNARADLGFVSMGVAPGDSIDLRFSTRLAASELKPGTDVCYVLSEIPRETDTLNNIRCQEIIPVLQTDRPCIVGLTLYPNPSRGEVMVEFAAPTQLPGLCTLYDANGRRVRSFDFQPGASRYPLSLNGLPEGIYLYKIVQGTQEAQGRLVLIH